MGHGARFTETKIPLGAVVEAYAALGNLRDAVDKTETLIDKLGQDDTDKESWEGLEVWERRIKSRSITLQTIIRKLRKSQES